MNKVLEQSVKYRKWQNEAFDAYVQADQRDFLALVTPGAGKTIWALRVAKHLLEAEKVDRVIVVSPSLAIKDLWREQAEHLHGIKIPDLLDFETGCHGCVTTYQQVYYSFEYFAEISGNSRLLVIFDEIHHGAEKKAWGKALRSAFESATVRLCLTGTAFRSDSDKIPFVNYDQGWCQPDFSFGYSEAVSAGFCRALEFPVWDGEIRWIRGGNKKQSTFGDKLSCAEIGERMKMALEPDGDFMRSMLSEADTNLRTRPGRAGLVMCQSAKHARAIVEVLRGISGQDPTLAICDEAGSRGRIQEFSADRSKRWIVAIRMVSEGVDIPRVDTLVWAANWLTPLFFRQAIGRTVRVEAGSYGGRAFVYLPGDPRLIAMAESVREEVVHFVEELEEADSGFAQRGERSPSESLEFVGSVGRGDRILRVFDEVGVDEVFREPGDLRKKYYKDYCKNWYANLSPEQKSEHNKKSSFNYANLSPEQRSECAKRSSLQYEKLSPEQKSELLNKAVKKYAEMTPEKKKKKYQDYLKRTTPEQRSAYKSKWWANLSPEKKAEIAIKAAKKYAEMTPEKKAEILERNKRYRKLKSEREALASNPERSEGGNGIP